MIRSLRIKVTTTGGAAVATGNATSRHIDGRLLAVVLYPHASLPATSDTTVTLRNPNNDADVETLATFTNLNAITKRYPRKEVDDGAGTSLAAANKTNVFTEFALSGQVKVAVAQADALTDAVTVDIIYDGEEIG